VIYKTAGGIANLTTKKPDSVTTIKLVTLLCLPLKFVLFNQNTYLWRQ
jgi:hypothetical protein